MALHKTFARNEVFPSWFANRIQDFLSAARTDLVIERVDATNIRVAVQAPLDISAVCIQGNWRFRTTTVSRVHPGGSAGIYDIWATGSNNDVDNSPDPFTDHTDYNFDLRITSTGVNPTSVDIFEKIGELDWSGSAITGLRQTLGKVTGAMLDPLALGGTQITRTRQADGSILLGLATDSVTATEIAANAVGSSEIATDAVGSAEIAADAVGNSELADNAVAQANMQDDSVGAAEIIAGAVGASEIAADAVGNSELAIDAVSQENMQNDSVGAAEIITDSVGTLEIAPDAVTATEIATDAVGSTEIAANAVGSSEIATDAVGTAEIASDAVTADEIAPNTITAAEIAADAVGNSELGPDAVTATEIAANAVGSSEIAANAVAASEIAADAVGTDELQFASMHDIESGLLTSGAETIIVTHNNLAVGTYLMAVTVEIFNDSGATISATSRLKQAGVMLTAPIGEAVQDNILDQDRGRLHHFMLVTGDGVTDYTVTLDIDSPGAVSVPYTGDILLFGFGTGT